MRHRVGIRYAIDGDLRFVSHHDTLRMFERALVRAGIPLRYSSGFNPRPRLSVALPRSVGVSSDDELLVVELESQRCPSEIVAALAARMPPGAKLLSAEALDADDRRLPTQVRYVVPIDPAARETAAAKAAEFLAREQVIVERNRPGRSAAKAVDIRRFVRSIDAADGALTWTQAVTPAGTARPDEVLEALGLSARDHLHCVRRAEVRYDR